MVDFRKHVHYQVGQCFTKGSTEYKLCRIKPCFVTLISQVTGCSYDNQIHNVADDMNITIIEMCDIACGNWSQFRLHK